MCGRYQFSFEGLEEIANIIRMINQKYYVGQAPEGEVFPTNIMPVLTGGEGAAMKWGYPRWNGGGVVINARSETAHEKRMFSKSVRTKRCVVPSTGFFEWRRADGKKRKDKYLFNLPGKKAVYMAGVWNTFKLDENNTYDAFVILTTAANESMADLHDRMPLILDGDERRAWLEDNTAVPFILNRTGHPMLSRSEQ